MKTRKNIYFKVVALAVIAIAFYNPQIEMFAHFKTKSSFHKTKCIN